LRNEGLFDQERKRPIPKLPKNILLLASSTSAALSDFTKVLGSRRGGITIYQLPIKTQGVGAEFEILEKLNTVNNLTKDLNIDTVVLTRGGGSSDDLFVFNSEKVVRALYSINRPTIGAIGHERDTTLAELVADLRASTPSNAAELVSLSRNEVLHQTSYLWGEVLGNVQERHSKYSLVKGQLVARIYHNLKMEVDKARALCQKTDGLMYGLMSDMRLLTQNLWQKVWESQFETIHFYKQKTARIQNLDSGISYRVQTVHLQSSQSLETICWRVKQAIQHAQNQLELLCCKVELYDHKEILAKGFSLVWQGGAVVTKISDVDRATPLRLQMTDGEIDIEQK
jgi:exodeoxyribonuclease VII large subunit